MVVVELCKGDKHDETGSTVELYLRSWSCRIPVCRAARAAFGVLGSFVGLLKDRFCTCDDILAEPRQMSGFGVKNRNPALSITCPNALMITYAFSRYTFLGLPLLATMITFKDSSWTSNR
jgi:hypothetical protein